MRPRARQLGVEHVVDGDLLKQIAEKLKMVLCVGGSDSIYCTVRMLSSDLESIRPPPLEKTKRFHFDFEHDRHEFILSLEASRTLENKVLVSYQHYENSKCLQMLSCEVANEWFLKR